MTLRDANQCTISSTVSILPLSGNCSSNILITPNPSSNYFNILVDASRLTDRIKIRVYNGVGKLVYSTYGNQVSAYKFGDDLAKGVYFISVESGSDTFKFRVIKN